MATTENWIKYMSDKKDFNFYFYSGIKMDRNDRELRSSPAILCKIAVAVMVNISRPPNYLFAFASSEVHSSKLQPRLDSPPASSLPTDPLYDSILQQYE